MQFILNETEFQEFLTLKEQNSELSHKLEVARSVNEKDRSQIKELASLVEQGKQSIKERDERINTLRKLNAEFEGTLAARDCIIKSLEKKLADLSAKAHEMERDCLGASKVLEETRKISAKRLESMNNLMREVRRLKAEHVCIVQNPRTGTVRVASVVKADTYRQFGWTVSEEFLVDRPA